MKKQLLIPCFLLAAASLHAQQQHFNLFKKNAPDKHRSFVNNLLMYQTLSPNTAQKPTGIQQRVIAQAIISADEGMEDTVTYKYSGSRGSKYNHNVIDEFGYRSYFSSDYLSGPFFEISAKKNDVLADSITFYDGADPYEKQKAFYRTDNKIDSFFTFYESGPATNTEKTLQAYNANGTMAQYVVMNDYITTPNFDTQGLRKFWYNTAGSQLAKDTLYVPDGANLAAYYATVYHYNSQNNLDSIFEYENNGSTYDLSRLTAILYDAGNRVNKIVQSEYGQIDTTTSVDTIGYTGTLPFFTFYENRLYWGDDEPFIIGITKHVGNNNLPDSAIVYTNDNGPIETVGILKYAYNSYNNPDSVIGINPDGTFAGRYNFYYETYDDGNNVGIKDVTTVNPFSIYPNPFGNQLNIAWKNERTSAKISLINMVGQTVFSENKYLTTGNNSIDMPAALSTGNYILLIQDDKGNTYNNKLLKK